MVKLRCDGALTGRRPPHDSAALLLTTRPPENFVDRAVRERHANGSTAVRLTEKGLKHFFRTCPRDDLISGLIERSDWAQVLTDAQLRSLCVLLLMAGSVLPVAVQAASVFKWVGPDGVVHYDDQHRLEQRHRPVKVFGVAADCASAMATG